MRRKALRPDGSERDEARLDAFDVRSRGAPADGGFGIEHQIFVAVPVRGTGLAWLEVQLFGHLIAHLRFAVGF